jgi:hydrogenase maturation protein HypF
MPENLIARKVQVNGIVQGVGFRPFVYQLAVKHGLRGEVANTSTGVSIHIEGPSEGIQSFCNGLARNGPPLAMVNKISIQSDRVEGLEGFFIAKSVKAGFRSTLISPDVCVCGDCLRELFDPEDLRYRYPFINCTNCGPRYTIITDIPYDRPNTSMRGFRMCKRCQAEYDDPVNRRFHAQPNACPDCGPHVALYDAGKKSVLVQDPVSEAIVLLKRGCIVAIKGIGGFHLAADAENNEAVARLRARKKREQKPLAVMSYDLDHIRKYARIESEEEALLSSPHRPIVLLKKRYPHTLSDEVSPRNRYFGAMLPYTPLHYLLLEREFTALVMTSGNISEEPIAIDNEDAFGRLSGIADYFLTHNRDIYLRSDDSIVKRTAGGNTSIRRSRGYAPSPIFLKQAVPQILACGAELKNTVCLTKQNMAFLSQHIGDLENLATYEFFKMTIDHMKRIMDITPEIIAYDLHPDYLSTSYAREQRDLKAVGVQHHHAHIVSCMAENLLDGPVIGLSFDGTGYGTDGHIWGGEIIIAELDGFERTATISYVPMPGSTKAIREPWRMAISYLFDAFGGDFVNLGLPFQKAIEEKKIQVITEMIKKGINSPFTSSLGRLFDGISAMIGIRNHVAFEGQAAIELEMVADKTAGTTYDYEWQSGEMHRLLPAPIVRGVVRDLQRGVAPPEISGKFHATLTRAFSQLCEVIRKETGLNRVALSGGVFQNSILLAGIVQALRKKRFQVFTHHHVPANDGGISLGQALVAAASSKKR